MKRKALDGPEKTCQTPPKMTRSIVDKDKKYDRQLRLWGDHGQERLETAKVCVINASAVGTEVLKNLVLPVHLHAFGTCKHLESAENDGDGEPDEAKETEEASGRLEISSLCQALHYAQQLKLYSLEADMGIGSFTIVDDHNVSGEDIGNNFFLSKECLGKSLAFEKLSKSPTAKSPMKGRAQAAVELLQELNPDVSGNFVNEDPCEIMSNNADFFKEFTVVVGVGLSERMRLKLSSLLWEADVPLLVCSAYGMIGSMQLSVREHTVVESHPDNAFEDLRLDQPFPKLKKFSDSLDLNNMSKIDHSHTPYVILLLKYLEKWKLKHDGKIPQTYKEKHSFKELIRQGILVRENGVPEIEDNFEEALKAVNTSLNTSRIPSRVEEILNDSSCETVTSSSSSFWMLCKALKEFVSETGSLPLRGSIPDMTADSKRFIALQNVYHEKAMEDKENITEKLGRILNSVGKPADFIKEDEIRLFCKNSAFLHVIRCRSPEEEYNSVPADLASCLEEPDSDAVFYVLLRAVDKFYTKFNKYPGELDEDVEGDCEELQSCVSTLLKECGIHNSIKEDYIREMCRYGACELHPVAAFMGGAVAQEVIKLITHQYLPFHDFYIYNAITGSSVTLTF